MNPSILRIMLMLVIGLSVPTISALADDAAVKKEVLAAHKARVTVWKSRDAGAYMKLLAPEYDENTDASKWIGHEAAVKRLTDLFANTKLKSYTSTPESVNASGSTAIVMEHVKASGLAKGDDAKRPWIPYTRDIHYRLTYIKTTDGWKLQKRETIRGVQITGGIRTEWPAHKPSK